MAAIERAGRAGAAAGRGLRSLASPAGLRGCGTELAWIAAHAALYPLGVLAEKTGQDTGAHRLDRLSPLHRGLLIADVEAAGTPILLVHGLADNRSVFTVLRRSLRRRGFGRVHTVNYSPLTRDVRAAARSLGRAVESLCEQTGYERVHVIAHSLGGVIARYYVQRLGGDARVHTLVTLGAPHARHPERPAAAGPALPAAAAGLGPAHRAGRPGGRLPDPVRRRLERPGPGRLSQGQRPDRPPGPGRPECPAARGRPHLAAGRRPGRPGGQPYAGPPRPGRRGGRRPRTRRTRTC